MRKPVTSCLILLILLTCPTHGQFHLDVDKTLLPNGLTLLTCVDTTALTVSYQTFVDAGSRDETRAGATGIARILEHRMFGGTERFPDYGRAVDSLGAQSSSYTTMDYTCYAVNSKPARLKDVIDLESNRIRSLELSDQTYLQGLEIAREERKRRCDDNPVGYMYQELYRLAYKRHTYHHPIVGWERDLERSLTYEDVEVFKNMFYAPNYCTIVISGNFDSDQAAEWVFQHYGDWRTSLPPTSQVRAEPRQDKRRRRDLEWTACDVAPRMLIAYKGPDLNLDKLDLAALQVLSNALFSKTGMLSVRLKSAGMAREISGYIEGAKDPGLFIIDAILGDKTDFDSVLAVVDRELASIAKNLISDYELARAVNCVRSEFLRDLTTPPGIAKHLGYYQLVGGDYRMMFAYYDLLGKVTSNDVSTTAEEHLAPRNSTVITLSPLSSDAADDQ